MVYLREIFVFHMVSARNNLQQLLTTTRHHAIAPFEFDVDIECGEDVLRI